MPLSVAIVTVVAFLPALQGEFVTWDDDRNFLDNPSYRGLGWTQLQWMWTTFHMGHYVPLSWMTLGLDYVIWGMNPLGYHITNVLLHASNAVVIYFLARRVLVLAAGPDAVASRSMTLASAFAALLFATHPLRVESVAWITERRDVLSGLFYFSSILCYLRSAQNSESHRARSLATALALFLCALLSKATAMTLPAVLLILLVYPLRRLGGEAGWWNASVRRVYLELVPFVLLSSAAAVLSIIALRPPDQLSFSAKLAVSAYSLGFYVLKTVLPTGLAPLYPMPNRVDPVAGVYVASYLAVIALSGIAFAMRHRRPAATTAWIAFLVIMLPMLGVVQNGPQIAADRYTYHAAPALAILCAGWVATFVRPVGGATRIAPATIVLALAALTWRQSGFWHDSMRLWTRVLAVSSESSIGHVAFGSLLVRQGRLEDGVAHYERGLAIDSAYPEGYNNLGVALVRLGRIPEAIERYRRAVALRPNYPEAHENWGAAIAQQNDLDGAIAHYRQALSIDSTRATAHVNWGNALVRQRRNADAIPHYRDAVRLRPDLADAQLNWGVALAQGGQFAEAIEHFQVARALDPTRAETGTYLARASQLLHDGRASGTLRQR